MLLVYPPVARSPEPPIGLSRLAGLLRARGVDLACLDLNQEGQEWLLGLRVDGTDTWTHGAQKRLDHNLALLRSEEGYRDFQRYSRAVRDLGRSISAAGAQAAREAQERVNGGVGGPCAGLPRIGLADYSDPGLSPLKRADLLAAAALPEASPFFPFYSRRLDEALQVVERDNGQRIVGISLIYLSQAIAAFSIAGFLKSRHPDISVVLGGGLVTSWIGQGIVPADETFGGLFDALLPGRGEDAILDWLWARGVLPDAPGLAVSGSRRRPEAGACPDFSDFGRLGYLAPSRIIPYSFSTGCPWKRCEFCPEKAEDSPYVGSRADAAMRDLASLGRIWKPRLYHFTDNEVAPLYLRALAKTPPGAPWYGFARFSRVLEDPAFCRDLAASGCAMLQLGLESADQGVLDAMGKGTELGSIRRILANLRAAGVAVYLYVLFGTPTETRDSALRTRDFLLEEAGNYGWLNLAIFNMPASSGASSPHRTKSFYDGDLSIYCEFAHPAGWNRGEIRSFLRDELEGRDTIRAAMRRTPPIFTSNHAAFFASH